jgi:hypothetical protein
MLRWYSSTITSLAIAVPSLVAQSPVTHRRDWPKIRSFQFKTRVNAKSRQIFFSVPIYNVTGNVEYTFTCHGGTDEYLDSLEKSLGECIVSPMCFFLSKGSQQTTGALLAEDAAASWHTRAQVRYESLIGPCGDYPEFGRVRHFRVMAMQITVEFSNIQTDHSGQVTFLDISVSGKRDSSVTSSYAERPHYLPPGKDCTVIRKGTEPRMFRNESGSWVEEKDLRPSP